MSHPAQSGQSKVVMQNGYFSVAEVTDSRYPETHGSVKERERLMTQVGLRADGGLPGLLDWYARKMARKMGASRKGQRKARWA